MKVGRDYIVDYEHLTPLINTRLKFQVVLIFTVWNHVFFHKNINYVINYITSKNI